MGNEFRRTLDKTQIASKELSKAEDLPVVALRREPHQSLVQVVFRFTTASTYWFRQVRPQT